MKITELNNFYVGYNGKENFRILICASEIEDAKKIAKSYGKDAGIAGDWEVTEGLDSDMNFDCDYVVSYDEYKVSDVDENTEIKVIVGNGGLIEEVYVSPELKDADVEVIDFCTDDPDELDEVKESYDELDKKASAGKLINIY